MNTISQQSLSQSLRLPVKLMPNVVLFKKKTTPTFITLYTNLLIVCKLALSVFSFCCSATRKSVVLFHSVNLLLPVVKYFQTISWYILMCSSKKMFNKSQ